MVFESREKAGCYLDERWICGCGERLAHCRGRVIDVIAFVGAFAIAAARGGAREVVAVDESALAVAVGAECAAANGVGDRGTVTKGDARRALVEAEGEVDLVIADPPRLAPTRSAREQALVAH